MPPPPSVPAESPAASQFPSAALQKIIRLRELFARIPDRRVAGRVLHALPEVLLIALCAMVSDCEDFTDMGLFAQTQLVWLRQFTPLVNGAPSHDVFRNVFMALRPAALLEIMQIWVGELDGQHVAIDGKVSRGAKDTHTGKSSLHLLRAWVSAASLSVGQEACAGKSNELDALPRLLASLQLKGAIVTIDAMGGHPHIAEAIRAAGADYILALKANEKKAFEEIEKHFKSIRPEDAGAAWPESCAVSTSTEMNRGRCETREVVVIASLDWFTKSWKWQGLQSVICVRRLTMRQRHAGGNPAEEIHYYVSSLPGDCKRLGRFIRRHWSVENECHHVLDVTYHEDHCQVRDQTAAHNLTLIREIATKVIKANPLKGSIRSKRKRAALDPAFRRTITDLIFHTFDA